MSKINIRKTPIHSHPDSTTTQLIGYTSLRQRFVLDYIHDEIESQQQQKTEENIVSVSFLLMKRRPLHKMKARLLLLSMTFDVIRCELVHTDVYQDSQSFHFDWPIRLFVFFYSIGHMNIFSDHKHIQTSFSLSITIADSIQRFELLAVPSPIVNLPLRRRLQSSDEMNIIITTLIIIFSFLSLHSCLNKSSKFNSNRFRHKSSVYLL